MSMSEALKCHQTGQLDKAEQLYRQILQARPQDIDALHLLGVIQSQRQHYVQAVGLISQAIALDSTKAEPHHNLGTVYRILGNFVESEHHYRRALELKPDYGEAYFNLSAVRRFTPEDPMIPLLKTQLSASHTPIDRCYLHFAAGKVHDDWQDYDQAFSHYQQGNQLVEANYDAVGHEQAISDLINAFTPHLFQTLAGSGQVTHQPIFIIGMPRSGTTLVERILASHPQVQAVGELPDIASIAKTLPHHAQGGSYPSCIAQLPAGVFAGFGGAYLKRVTTLAPSALRTVDKAPRNFLDLGLIHLLFPHATLIHCCRHPLDTCLSCYFQKFRQDHPYSYALDTLGHYYRQYERLMQHYYTALPHPIFDVQYERLIQDPEATCRALLQFCQLPWDPNCLQFHRAQGSVTTASSWQVRQPLYQRSVQRWHHYEVYLDPLKVALGIEQ